MWGSKLDKWETFVGTMTNKALMISSRVVSTESVFVFVWLSIQCSDIFYWGEKAKVWFWRQIVDTKSRQTLKSQFNNMNWSLFFWLIKFAWTGYSLKAERSSEIWIFPGVSSASQGSLLTMNCSHVTHHVYIFHRCKTRILHTCGNLAGINGAGDEPVTVHA